MNFALDVAKRALKQTLSSNTNRPSNMKFGLDVAKHIINENLATGKNALFSPASATAVLNMITAGAVNSTKEQLLKVLGHNTLEDLNASSIKLSEALKSSGDKNTVDISYVNALWLDQRFKLKQDYAKVLKEIHNAHARVVDFVNQPEKAIEEVNAWAKQESRGLIDDILTRNNTDESTAMVLANCLYFKGMWQNPFESIYTQDKRFNLLDGSEIQVPFMKHRNENFDYGSFKECQVIRMPYKKGEMSNNNFSMYIFLPLEKGGLPNLMKNIEIHENMFEDQFKLNNVNVDVLSIPKFKFESDMTLRTTMKQLGLTLPFGVDCKDLSGIIDDDKEPLFVSEIIQKCCVETNEEGTKAAAVTMVLFNIGCSMKAPSKLIKFVADHPFMFMIREDTSGVILFVGTMLNPKS